MSETCTVIYNGSCPICSREIAHYARKAEATGAPVVFVDLAEADLAPLGLTPDMAARRIYVQDGDRLLSGVEAFALMWQRLPGFRWLGRFVSLPMVKPVAGVVYDRALAPLLYAMHRRRQARKAG
jgi:predicted DCC family thiol-disulfide oxidoreductase YuxK